MVKIIGRPLVMAYLHPKQIVTHRRPTFKRQLTSLVYYLCLFGPWYVIIIPLSSGGSSPPTNWFASTPFARMGFIGQSFSGFALIN